MMLEKRFQEPKHGILMGAQEDNSIICDKEDKLTYKCVRVDGEGSFVTASEDNVLEVEHLLAVPDDEKILTDDILCFESKNSELLTRDDVPCPDDCYQLNTDFGALDCNIMRDERQEPKFDFLDSILQGLNEDSFHDTPGFSSECADYLLGTGNGNLYTGELSACFSVKDVGAPGMLDSSDAAVSLPSQYDTVLDKMTIGELHEAFRKAFGQETSVKDKQWLKRQVLFALQNCMELENVSSLLDNGPSSHENEDGLLCTSGSQVLLEDKNMTDILKSNYSEGETTGFQISNLVDKENVVLSPKRKRKPTRRYIEESSDVSCRHSSGRPDTPVNSSMDNVLQPRSQNRLIHQRNLATARVISKEDIVGRSATDTRKPRTGRGRPRKRFSSLVGHDSDESKEYELPSVVPTINPVLESPQYESQDEEVSDDSILVRRSGKARRKHHRLWNLSEVMKLIEGVSRFGVGRWTDIKRMLFAASAHRTSVDLKDKWRNLLRASCLQMQSKKEMEQRKKHASYPIPQSVLRRVRELAIIYPYPRDRKSKLAQTATAASNPDSAAPSTHTNAAISRSGRVVHRKNFV